MLLLACARPGSVGGQVTDAKTQKPVSNLEIAWVSSGEGACARRATLTDAQGSYHLDGICPGLSYTLQLGDPDWWVDSPPLKADENGVSLDLQLWRIPAMAGVYTLEGDRLEILKTHSAVDRLPLNGQELRFPLEIPGSLPRIQEPKLLLLVGKETESLSFEPLLPGVAIQAGPPEAPQALGAWFYIGSKVLGPGQVEAAVVEPDPSHVKTEGGADRSARFVDANALPPGRYALGKPDARRVYLLDFGAP